MTLIEKYKTEICPYCTRKNKCNIGQYDNCVKCSGYVKDKSKITKTKLISFWVDSQV